MIAGKCTKCKIKLKKNGTMIGVGLTLRCPKCRTLFRASAFEKKPSRP